VLIRTSITACFIGLQNVGLFAGIADGHRSLVLAVNALAPVIWINGSGALGTRVDNFFHNCVASLANAAGAARAFGAVGISAGHTGINFGRRRCQGLVAFFAGIASLGTCAAQSAIATVGN
jgi:hypothetical protein